MVDDLQKLRVSLSDMPVPEPRPGFEDRVLANSGKPQVHGTHFTMSSDGLFRLAPVADPAGMAGRREKAGIMPLKLYDCFLEEGGQRIDRSSLPP